MAVPDFNLNGLVPPFMGSDPATADRSPYIVNIQDLVDRFSSSAPRKQLLTNLIKYRVLLEAAGYSAGIQFVDGSFVEDVERVRGRPPSDIDLFTIVAAPRKYVDDLTLWQSEGLAFWKSEIIDRNLNKSRFGLDTFGVIWEELSPMSAIQNVCYWYSLFAHQRDTFAWKGFFAVPLNATLDRIALSKLEAA